MWVNIACRFTSKWSEAVPKADNDVRQKLQDDLRRSPAVSAPGRAQTGQIGQKIVFNLELPNLAMRLGNFSFMVGFFLPGLAK